MQQFKCITDFQYNTDILDLYGWDTQGICYVPSFVDTAVSDHSLVNQCWDVF